MKLFFLSFCTLAGFAAAAQPKVITNAVISTSTNVIAPDEEDVSQLQNQGGGGFRMANMSFIFTAANISRAITLPTKIFYIRKILPSACS